jgi:hypothetical protein
LEGLTEGRMVHYVLATGPNKGSHRPAVIVRIWTKEAPYTSQLQVFTDGANDGLDNVHWATSVTYDESGEKQHSWHWIERA